MFYVVFAKHIRNCACKFSISTSLGDNVLLWSKHEEIDICHDANLFDYVSLR